MAKFAFETIECLNLNIQTNSNYTFKRHFCLLNECWCWTIIYTLIHNSQRGAFESENDIFWPKTKGEKMGNLMQKLNALLCHNLKFFKRCDFKCKNHLNCFLNGLPKMRAILSPASKLRKWFFAEVIIIFVRQKSEMEGIVLAKNGGKSTEKLGNDSLAFVFNA